MSTEEKIRQLQATLQSNFVENTHPLYEAPKAPFGDSTLYVVFFKEESKVQLDGEFTLEQVEALAAEMRRRAGK